MTRLQTGLRTIVVLPIRLYKVALSPLFPPACRFYPCCSSYAERALLTHGLTYGSWLAIRRVLRCHPWAESGVDPVPDTLR